MDFMKKQMFIIVKARDYLKEQEFIILGHSTGLSFKVYSNKDLYSTYTFLIINVIPKCLYFNTHYTYFFYCHIQLTINIAT